MIQSNKMQRRGRLHYCVFTHQKKGYMNHLHPNLPLCAATLTCSVLGTLLHIQPHTRIHTVLADLAAKELTRALLQNQSIENIMSIYNVTRSIL
ncbi:hypothetical protein GDO81_026584 [Engystomops pustulosus]|uniref:Uncharacterized protein n=1 Tax=Engystomops pustulosus TaxID=76066 RepID=A0AAV6ZFT0_ENGPU|nr:hypothetical protein GDO81_026584 [Engystomops pustulosus]